MRFSRRRSPIGAAIAVATALLLPTSLWAQQAPSELRDAGPPSTPASPAGWDDAPFQGVPVASIFVRAPEPLRASATEAVAVRVGTPYDIADMRRSLQNIYSLGNVSDVQVSGEQTPGGLRLEFVVLPAAHVHELRFAGDSPIRKGTLQDAMTGAIGDRVSRQWLERQADNVQQALSGHGYTRARVEPELVLDNSGLEATVVFHLDAGMATRLSRLDFVGDLGVSEAEVRAAFGWTEGAVFRSVELGDAIDRVRRALAEAHFFYADVSIGSQATSLAANTEELQIQIDAGPRVELNVRGWTGGDEELREMLPFYEETSIADWILIQARADIIAELQRQGHWKPLVSYGRQRDDAGRNVVVDFTIAPASEADLQRVDIEGNSSIDTETLRGLMETRQRGLLRRAPFVTSIWEQDQRAVLGRYRASGFLQARITEAPVSRDPELGGLRAVLRIDEGAQTVVSQVDIVTDAGLSGYGLDSSGWSSELQLRTGGPYDPAAVRSDETRLRILLANQGYPRALVSSEITEHADPYAISVAFSVFPGRRVRVGQLLISGNRRVNEDVIRRELSLVPGSAFTQEDAIRSQSRLYQLGLFSRVDIDTARPDSVETEPTVVVRVEEGSSRRLSWGLGYSTEEQARGLLVVGEDNLWGLNHRATTSIRASFAEQRVRFIYTDPYLFGRHVEGSGVAYFESIDQEGFKVQQFGASFQAVKRHSENLTSIGRYSFRNQQAYDIEIDDDLIRPEDRDAVVGSIIYSLLADTRPNPIEPRSGNYHTFDTELAARGLGSESDFFKVFGRSYWYWGMPNDAVIVAAARVGVAIPYRDSIVPLPERFFAGGSTTLRGFGRNQAGPTDSNGNPIGGNVLLIGNLEYRIPIKANFGAVIFADIGNVFAAVDAISGQDIRQTLGVGIRYSTPIGPLRLDWGHLISQRSGEDGSRLHFAIGQAF